MFSILEVLTCTCLDGLANYGTDEAYKHKHYEDAPFSEVLW